jgi:hypothetical protein
MGIPDRHAAIYAQILPVRGEKMRLFGFFQQAGSLVETHQSNGIITKNKDIDC